MNKKILIHSIAFSPDGVSTAYLYNDIALKFKDFGYEVAVLTTTPHYNIVNCELENQPLKKKAWGFFYESDYKGIKIKHVYQKKYRSTALRVLGFVYWHIVSFILGLFEKDIDIILSPSPPLTIGFLNILIGKLKGAKIIYNVQEIYPDLLIEEGGLKSGLIISFLKWMEKFVYNNSDAVTTIDQIFYNTIVNRFKEPRKLHTIPNFVDTEIYKPISQESLHLDETIFPKTESLKIMYAGNIGIAQDWEPLINLACELKKDLVEFIILGEGAMKKYIENEIASRNLGNIKLLPYQPRELMPAILAYSDLQFIFMAPKTEGHGFPSKVYTIMACAKPILVCSGENTPIINFLQDKDCAYIITEKDNNLKTKKLANIIRNISLSELKSKGNNGLLYIEENYSKQHVTQQYINLAEKIIQ